MDRNTMLRWKKGYFVIYGLFLYWKYQVVPTNMKQIVDISLTVQYKHHVGKTKYIFLWLWITLQIQVGTYIVYMLTIEDVPHIFSYINNLDI